MFFSLPFIKVQILVKFDIFYKIQRFFLNLFELFCFNLKNLNYKILRIFTVTYIIIFYTDYT